MFYGVDGMRLGIYKVKFATNPTHIRFHKITESIYFGSKLIWQNGERIVTDRLGSVVQRGSTRLTYYPYGEEKGTVTPSDTGKFGTYYRDGVTGRRPAPLHLVARQVHHSGPVRSKRCSDPPGDLESI
jgi:hypothetical protein